MDASEKTKVPRSLSRIQLERKYLGEKIVSIPFSPVSQRVLCSPVIGSGPNWLDKKLYFAWMDIKDLFLVVDLDLDYLERRIGDPIGSDNADSGSKEEESPADSLDRVKVIFLGAPGVGKSSIIRVSNF